MQTRPRPGLKLPKVQLPKVRRPAPAGGAPVTPRPAPAATRLHCPIDDWDFDPRYTEGTCPICGWHPEGAEVIAAPAWLTASRRIDWDLAGLVILFAVLLLLGELVLRSVGLDWKGLVTAIRG